MAIGIEKRPLSIFLEIRLRFLAERARAQEGKLPIFEGQASFLVRVHDANRGLWPMMHLVKPR